MAQGDASVKEKPVTAPISKAEVKLIAQETVKESLQTFSKQIVADMTPLCYEIAENVSQRTLKEFSNLFEHTFHIRMHDPATIEQLQATLSFCKRLRERAESDNKVNADGRIRLRYTVLASVVSGVVMLLIGYYLKGVLML